MKPGLEKPQLSYDDLETDCPHCGAEGTLAYGMRDMDLDEDGRDDTTVPVEGLICKECNEIFMSIDESVRLLNIKAKYEGLDVYFGVHDGDIRETRLQ